TCRFAIFAGQVIELQGCCGPRGRKSAVVPTKSILKAANVPIIGGHHVLALQSSPEGWQTTPLLERCREHAGRLGGAWCSGMCCTWARSTTRRNWRGGAPNYGARDAGWGHELRHEFKKIGRRARSRNHRDDGRRSRM